MNKTWDEIKREVNIAEFAINNYGFHLNEKKSSISWKLLEKGDEKIIVNKKNEHFLYFNPENDLDKGSIIDFVLYREPNLKVKDVYIRVNQYIGNPEQQKIQLPNTNEEKKFNRENFLLNYTELIKTKFNTAINLEFFKNRGIDTALLKNGKFVNTIYSQPVKIGDKTYSNTLFPLKDQTNQTIGFDVRNKAYKGTIGLKKAAFWQSNYDTTKPVHIILTDSPLDAIAHFELYGKALEEKRGDNILYLSSAGTLQLNQIKTLNSIINDKAFTFGKIGFGFDNKPADQRFTTRVLGNLKLPKEESKENDILSNAVVNPFFVNKEDNYIEIKINTKTREDAISTLSYFHGLIAKYNKIQAKFSGEEKTFQIKDEILKDNSLNLQLEFNNHLGNWITSNEMIKEFKFSNSPKIEFIHPRGKDFNEELQIKKANTTDKLQSLER